MHLRTGAALGLLLTALVPGVAHATSVRVVETEYDDDRYDVYSEFSLQVTGNAREANRVVFREVADGVFVIEDRGSKRPMIAGRDCRRTERRKVVCRPDDALDEIVVDLRDRDDRFSARGRKGSEVEVDGGTGDDRISSERTALSAAGGAGRDTLIGSSTSDSLNGGSGNDVLRGGGGDDSLAGGPGADRATGGTGDDTFDGNDLRGVGKDVFDGGRGSDTISYDARRSVVRVDLAKQRGGKGGTEDRYRSVENAIGGNATDTLLGSDGPNRLDGSAGFDYVSGRGGNDVLDGARVLGGKGDDIVTFTNRRSNCGEGTDRVLLPDRQVYVPRTCELLKLSYGLGDTDVPARAVALTDETITFELVCASGATCTKRRLRLLDTAPPATAAAPAVVADVAVPDTPAYAKVRVEVPRTGVLVPQQFGRRLEVVVDARIPGFAPLPASATALGTYRIDLDL